MRRRDFLQMTTAGTAVLASRSAWAHFSPLVESNPRFPASFLAWNPNDVDLDLTVLEGTLPDDLRGHLFMAGMQPKIAGAPAFNGDGKLCRFDFDGTKVSLKGRMLKPSCYYAEQAFAGTPQEFMESGFNRAGSLGARNLLNVAFQPMMDGRMLATYDAGRPWEIDPVELRAMTPVGKTEDWAVMLGGMTPWNKPVFPQMLACAHPVYDPLTQEMFCANPSVIPLVGFLDLIRWNGKGMPRRWRLVNRFGVQHQIESGVHQIAMTRDHVLLLDSSVHVELSKVLGTNMGHCKAPKPYSVLYIVKRSDLNPWRSKVFAEKVVIPRESAHFLVDYENDGPYITVHLFHQPATDVSEWLFDWDTRHDTGGQVRPELAGTIPFFPMDLNVLGKHIVHAEKGEVVESRIHFEDPWTWGLGVYALNPNASMGTVNNYYYQSLGFWEETGIERVYKEYTSYAHRIVPVRDLPWEGKPCTLFRFDTQAMRIPDGYTYPMDHITLSNQFMPRRGTATGDTDGYIVSIVSSDHTGEYSSGSELWVFDAANLAQGPVAKLGHPDFKVGFTVHTSFTESLTPWRGCYHISARDDLHERVGTWNRRVRERFESEVFPHFA